MPNVTVPLEIAVGGTEVLKQPRVLQKNHSRAVLTISIQESDRAVKNNSNNCLLQFEVLIKKKKAVNIRLRLQLDAVSS